MRTGGLFSLPGAASPQRCENSSRNGEFVEVEAAILQVSPGNEAHLHAFETALHGPDGTKSHLFLHTSPEFACKKLLARARSDVRFRTVFRNRERGALHHPEFTC